MFVTMSPVPRYNESEDYYNLLIRNIDDCASKGRKQEHRMNRRCLDMDCQCARQQNTVRDPRMTANVCEYKTRSGGKDVFSRFPKTASGADITSRGRSFQTATGKARLPTVERRWRKEGTRT